MSVHRLRLSDWKFGDFRVSRGGTTKYSHFPRLSLIPGVTFYKVSRNPVPTICLFLSFRLILQFPIVKRFSWISHHQAHELTAIRGIRLEMLLVFDDYSWPIRNISSWPKNCLPLPWSGTSLNIRIMTQVILNIKNKRDLPFLKRLSKNMGWTISGQDTPNE